MFAYKFAAFVALIAFINAICGGYGLVSVGLFAIGIASIAVVEIFGKEEVKPKYQPLG